MTLTTHALVAAAAAKPFVASHPALIFLIALASHYVIDAVPHWDYRLRSMIESEKMEDKGLVFSRATFGLDLLRSALDAILGLGIVALLVWPQNQQELIFTLLAVIGGIMPDFLQGIYYGLRLNFLKPPQQLHDWIHARIKLGPYPKLGIPFQLILVIIAIYFLI